MKNNINLRQQLEKNININNSRINRQNFSHNHYPHSNYQLQDQPILSNLIAPINIIRYNNFKFILTETPNELNVDIYFKILKRENCDFLIEATNEVVKINSGGLQLIELLTIRNGINLKYLHFDEGVVPSDEIINTWIQFLESLLFLSCESSTLAIMCHSGLSSGPFLIAIALIEFGEEYFHVINFIRSLKRGALNCKHIQFLQEYKLKSKILKEKQKQLKLQTQVQMKMQMQMRPRKQKQQQQERRNINAVANTNFHEKKEKRDKYYFIPHNNHNNNINQNENLDQNLKCVIM